MSTDRFIENMHHDPAPQPDEQLMAAEEFCPDRDDPAVNGIRPDAIAIILQDLVFRRGSRVRPISPTFWRSATVRLAALAWCVDSEVRRFSQAEVAEAIGVCRATLTAEVVKLRDLGHLDCRGGRSEAAREAYRQRQSKIWRLRRQAPTGGHAAPGQPKSGGKRQENGSKRQVKAAGNV